MSMMIAPGRRSPDPRWRCLGNHQVSCSRAVVGPDEPFGGRSLEDIRTGHWAHLAEVLRRQGVVVQATDLEGLPHDVVLTERLLALVGPAAGAAAASP